MARKLVIDSFAGGGGASQGLCEALGRGPDIAINHDADALAMHAANHPDSKHVLEDVWKADLKQLVGKRKVGLLWASPDCTHFSRAKGGKPVKKAIRSLAWIVVKWAMQVRPEVIILENVREFAEWGPLVPRWACRGCDWRGTEGQVIHRRKVHRCPRCDSRKISPTEDMIPCPKRKGLTFRKWTGRLRNLGYTVQYKTLDAADFGAPTHRKRLFLIARCDGKPIVWPQTSHAAPAKMDRYPLFERPKPHRTAAEIIDWDLPALSIFASPAEASAWAKEHKRGTPKRPLQEKTLRRIALGIKRYVLDNPRPFIVHCEHGGDHFRGQPLEKPLSSVTGNHGFGVVTPFVSRVQNGDVEFRGQSVAEPLATVTAKPKGGGFAVVTPFLAGTGGSAYAGKPRPADYPIGTVKKDNHQAVVVPTLIQTGYGEREGQQPRVPGLDKPLGTVVADGQKHALVSAVLSQFHGQKADESRCRAPDQPINTLDTENRYGLVAASLQKFYGGVVGHTPDRPLGTITEIDHHGLLAASLTKHYGTAIGQPVDAACPTTTAGGNHTGLIGAHLVKFRGDSDGQAIEHPVPTITSGAGAARPAGAAHALGLAAANLIRVNHGEKQWNGADEPLCTVTSQGNKFGVVYAFLAKYFGTAIGQAVDKPLGTQTAVDRYALVTVEVAPGTFTEAIAVNVPGIGHCVIADIALRMLRPRELARAQGFPDSYKLLGSTANQVAKIGNSVPPVMAKALAAANYLSKSAKSTLV